MRIDQQKGKSIKKMLRLSFIVLTSVLSFSSQSENKPNFKNNLSSHDKEVNEFLLQLNDAGKNGVLVVGATNRPDLIDSAILRAGRMDKRIYVGPPDFAAREKLFDFFLEGRPLDEEVSFKILSGKTEGYAASDIELIVNEAARSALLGDFDSISQSNLEQMIKKLPSSLSSETLNSYQQFFELERK